MKLLDLKIAIVEQNSLDKGLDFDLIVTNADTEEAFADDKFHVPKNTRVIVRRAPAAPTGGIISHIEELRTKQKKEEIMAVGGTAGTGMVATHKAPPVHQLGAEFASAGSTLPSAEAEKPKAVLDPRMRDDSDDSDDDEEVDMLALLQQKKEEEEKKIAQLAISAEQNRVEEMRAAREAARAAMGKRRGPKRFVSGGGRGRGRGAAPPGAQGQDDGKAPGKDAGATPSGAGGISAPFKKVDAAGDSAATEVDESIPEQFRCPLTKKVLVDAVLMPCCGTTVSKQPAKDFLFKNNYCCPNPDCPTYYLEEGEEKKPIKASSLKPNHIVRRAVAEYVKATELSGDSRAVKEQFKSVDAKSVVDREREAALAKEREGADLMLSVRVDAPKDNEVGGGAKGEASNGQASPPPQAPAGLHPPPPAADQSLGGYGAPPPPQASAGYGGYGAPPPPSNGSLGGYGAVVPPSNGSLGGYGAPPPCGVERRLQRVRRPGVDVEPEKHEPWAVLSERTAPALTLAPRPWAGRRGSPPLGHAVAVQVWVEEPRGQCVLWGVPGGCSRKRVRVWVASCRRRSGTRPSHRTAEDRCLFAAKVLQVPGDWPHCGPVPQQHGRNPGVLQVRPRGPPRRELPKHAVLPLPADRPPRRRVPEPPKRRAAPARPGRLRPSGELRPCGVRRKGWLERRQARRLGQGQRP